MAKGEYKNLFVEPSMPTGDFPPKAPRVVFDSEAGFGDTTFGFRYSYFTWPPFQFEEPHKHDYDQFLCFLGTPENAREFDTEVEVSLGDECEKHLIDKTTASMKTILVQNEPKKTEKSPKASTKQVILIIR